METFPIRKSAIPSTKKILSPHAPASRVIISNNYFRRAKKLYKTQKKNSLRISLVKCVYQNKNPTTCNFTLFFFFQKLFTFFLPNNCIFRFKILILFFDFENRMEDAVRSMVVHKGRLEQLKQEKSSLITSYEVSCMTSLSIFNNFRKDENGFKLSL